MLLSKPRRPFKPKPGASMIFVGEQAFMYAADKARWLWFDPSGRKWRAASFWQRRRIVKLTGR